MRGDSILQKVEIYLVTAVAAVFVLGVAFLLTTTVSVRDHISTDISATSSSNASRGSSTPAHESQPAILEPGLRNVDVAAHHG